MRPSDMPLLGCSDAPSLPVLRFGLGPHDFLFSEVTVGLLGSRPCSQAWSFFKDMQCGRLAKCPARSWGACLPFWPDSPGSCSTPVVCPTLLLTRGVSPAWFKKREGMHERSVCWRGNRKKYSLRVVRSCWVLGYIFLPVSFCFPGGCN